MRSLLRPLRGEGRKLRHPLVLLAVLFVFGYLWSDARATCHLAATQTPVAIAGNARFHEQNDPACFAQPLPTDEACESQRLAQRLNDNFEANARKLGAVAQSLNTFPGVLRFVATELATGVGWLLLTFLVALHVAGEWNRESAGLTLSASGSRCVFLLTKTMSVWLATVVAMIVVAAGLMLSRATFAQTIPEPIPARQDGPIAAMTTRPISMDPAWTSLRSVAGVVVVMMVVSLIIGGLFVSVATRFRRPLVLTLLLVALLIGSVQTANGLGRPGLTPMRPVAQLLGLASTFGVRDARLWDLAGRPTEIGVPAPPGGTDILLVVAWIAVFGAVTAALSALFLRDRQAS